MLRSADVELNVDSPSSDWVTVPLVDDEPTDSTYGS